jgi:non-homologous end joining protein Ku
MSDAVSRKSGTTILSIGSVRTPIALYKIIGDAGKARQWELANAAGEPFTPPVPGTATGALPESSGGISSPLGDSPQEAQGLADSVETTLNPDGEKAEPQVPDPVFKKDDEVFLVDGTKWIVMSNSHVAADGDSPGYWQYALSEDGTAVNAYDENPVPEMAIYARSPQPRKGIRKADGVFVDLTDEIEEVAERSTLEEMRVVSFIDVRHVPRERIIGSYYLAGDDLQGLLPPTRLLAVLMRAMRASSKVAVVRFSKRVGQTLGVLTPQRNGALLLLELAYSAQERSPNPRCLAHAKVEPREGEVEGALELIESMAGKRDSLDGIRDARLVMEDELIARAEAGELDEYELTGDDAEDHEIDQLGQLLASAAA